MTLWMDVDFSFGLGLPFGFGVMRREFDANTPDDHTSLYDCSVGGSVPFISVESLGVSSSGSAKLYSASFNNQMELGAGMGCQFHGNTIEIKRELLDFLIYQAMVPGVTANNFAASLISRIMNPVDISITELITSFRLTTSQDDDEFYMIEDIRYDYLVVGEWSNIEVDVYVLESDYYKMEVRSDVLASPWPPWDWQARVIENVYLYANQRNTITLRVKPDTETGEIAGLVISKRWTNYLGYCMESQIHTNLILFQRFLTEIPQEFFSHKRWHKSRYKH